MSGASQEYYCGTCSKYIAPTGKRVPYTGRGSDDVIVWIECPRCEERRLEREAEEESRRRREELRRQRVCALDGCGVLFVPGSDWQRFCCDEHRWAAHRLLKKQRGAVRSP